MATLYSILDSNEFVRGATAMVDVLQSVYTQLDTAYQTFNKFEITMSTFSGSLPQANEDLARLRDISDELGVSFMDAALPFAKLAAAGDEFTKEELFDVFTGVATALSGVQASGQDTQGVFLALQQIVSKGNVSMEELKQQLAERIPGAMKIAAESMGMGMDEFRRAVEAGEVDSADFLLKFAAQLEDTFKEAAEIAAESWRATLNRTKNDFFEWKKDLVKDTGSIEVWSEILKMLTESVVGNEELLKSAQGILEDVNAMALDLALIFSSDLSGAVGTAKSGFDNLRNVVDGMTTSYLTLKVAYIDLLMILEFGNAMYEEARVALGANNEALLEARERLVALSEANEGNMSRLKELVGWREKDTETVNSQSDSTDELSTSEENLTSKMKDNKTQVEELSDSNEKLLTTEQDLITVGKEIEQSWVDRREALKTLSEVQSQTIEDNAKEIYDTTKKIYEETGALAEEWYELQKQELEKTSNAWVEMGYITKDVADEYVQNALQEMFDKTESVTSVTEELTEAVTETSEAIQESTEAIIENAEALDEINSKTIEMSNSFTSSGDAVQDLAAELQNLTNLYDLSGSAGTYWASSTFSTWSNDAKNSMQQGFADAWNDLIFEFINSGGDIGDYYDYIQGNYTSGEESSDESSSSSSGSDNYSVINYFTESVSRSDVENITSEAARSAARS